MCGVAGVSFKQMRKKKCRVCRGTFEPFRPLQVCCTSGCAVEYAQKQRAKKEARELREAKVKAKDRRAWIKDAQDAFNKFIRARDSLLPCVSCGRHHEGQYHAGHYMPTSTRPSLRFNELNVWKQCSACNKHKHGNLVHYRIELIKRIGVDMVNWLEGEHEPAKYTIQDLQEIKAVYTRKARELKREAAEDMA